jgi:hypothetical protein
VALKFIEPARRGRKTAFQSAVESSSELADCYRKGLQALGSHTEKIKPEDTRLLEGSLNIDACILSKYPEEARWDYVLSYNGKAYYVEVHPADTSAVNTVIRKKNWLVEWLKGHPGLNSFNRADKMYWLPTNGYHILPESNQARRLATSGIVVRSTLNLP